VDSGSWRGVVASISSRCLATFTICFSSMLQGHTTLISFTTRTVFVGQRRIAHLLIFLNSLRYKSSPPTWTANENASSYKMLTGVTQSLFALFTLIFNDSCLTFLPPYHPLPFVALRIVERCLDLRMRLHCIVTQLSSQTQVS
jgi:hypothetical protein